MANDYIWAGKTKNPQIFNDSLPLGDLHRAAARRVQIAKPRDISNQVFAVHRDATRYVRSPIRANISRVRYLPAPLLPEEEDSVGF